MSYLHLKVDSSGISIAWVESEFMAVGGKKNKPVTQNGGEVEQMEQKKTLDLKVEELEERIAPGVLNGDHINANVHPNVHHVDVDVL